MSVRAHFIVLYGWRVSLNYLMIDDLEEKLKKEGIRMIRTESSLYLGKLISYITDWGDDNSCEVPLPKDPVIDDDRYFLLSLGIDIKKQAKKLHTVLDHW